ncbi:MAG: DUF1840 domain-containing protein [Tatlockia sp.]|nr:DUF1840 domain-containing protein [Tatlockia sp.]
MLVTFSCQEYENITMFGDIAKQLLILMGHSGTIPGALSAEEIPQALSDLKNRLKKAKTITNEAQNDEEDAPISLAHRAIPLIGMLEAASKAEKPILWS